MSRAAQVRCCASHKSSHDVYPACTYHGPQRRGIHSSVAIAIHILHVMQCSTCALSDAVMTARIIAFIYHHVAATAMYIVCTGHHRRWCLVAVGKHTVCANYGCGVVSFVIVDERDPFRSGAIWNCTFKMLDYMDPNNLGSQLGILQAPYSNATYDGTQTK